MISVWILISSTSSSTTLFKIEAIAEKQGNSKSVLTNDNNTITRANTTNNLVDEGISLLVVGKYNEAISLFDKVLAVDPNDVNTLTNKGNVLDTLGMHQEAIL
jgi:Flp pilus assembly protein TadD